MLALLANLFLYCLIIRTLVVDVCWLLARRLWAGLNVLASCQRSYLVYDLSYLLMFLCLVKVARVSQTLRGAGTLAESGAEGCS